MYCLLMTAKDLYIDNMNNIKYPFKIYVFFIRHKNIQQIYISHHCRSNQELR